MNREEVCGNCRFNKYDFDGSGIRQKGGFYCNNERSENCGCPTAYSDTCNDFEDRD